MSNILDVRDLHAYYGKGHILHGVDLCIGKGEIVSLLGRNGSGRSTTVKAIMGLVEGKGDIQWAGRNILGDKTFDIARSGIGYVPETRDVFGGLSVQQNLVLGVQTARRTRAGTPWTLDAGYGMDDYLTFITSNCEDVSARNHL